MNATYMQNKDAKLRLGSISTHSLSGNLHILLKLLDSIFQRSSRIIDLVHDQDSLSDQVLHLAKGRQIQPLGAGDLGAGSLDLVSGQGLVEGQADGLDGDVGLAGLLEERAEDAGRDVTATADGNHELGLEVREDPVGRDLAVVVYLD